MFSTVGVPLGISSDWRPELSSQNTQSYFKRWGLYRRNSSSYLPLSNGRADVAVESAKRLLMNNATGTLDTDIMVPALLMLRKNTDPTCKLSPAEVIFGRRPCDSFRGISKGVSIYDNSHITCRCKQAWNLKEQPLKERYVWSTENIKQHARPKEPLQVGDNILIQNQTGNNLTRWDHSSIVVETRDFDQYLVKYSGSGRLTLCNRQFLRKFELYQLYSNQNSNLGNQYLFADVSTSSIPTVTHGSILAAKCSIDPAALPPVNQPNSGSFDEPSAEHSSLLYQPKPVIGDAMPKPSAT